MALSNDLKIINKKLEDMNEKLLDSERDLRESERLYRAFIDSSGDLIFVKDDQLRYMVANKKLAEFYGVTEKEIIGKTNSGFLPEEVVQRSRLYEQEAISSAPSAFLKIP